MKKKILAGVLALSLFTGNEWIGGTSTFSFVKAETDNMVTSETVLDTLDLADNASGTAINASGTAIYNSADEVSYLAFGSDRHGDTTAINDAMGGMPKNVSYVGILGDIIGSNSKSSSKSSKSSLSSKAHSSSSSSSSSKASVIFDEIMALNFNNVLSKDNTALLWASHDKKITDDTGIVFGNSGSGSGVMYTGKKADGSVAYYVYGIAFYDMQKLENAKTAAKEFETWVDTITDRTIPIIVCCHMPLHYARKDNKGANAWNLALNYAATGYETTEASAVVSRNVIYLFGHNHTTESKTGSYSGEFFIPCESEMEIGVTENVWSRIFYTYTTAGYLKQNSAATLVTVESDEITLEKYQNSNVVDGLYDTKSKKSGIFANAFETDGTNVITKVDADAKCKVATVKATNPMLVAKSNATVTYTALKKKAQTIAAKKVVTIRNNKGTVTYKKTNGNSKITVNQKNGKITVKKGLKKGTYTIKYKIIAAGTKYYKKGAKTVTLKIVVS